jgi:transposase-like protein
VTAAIVSRASTRGPVLAALNDDQDKWIAVPINRPSAKVVPVTGKRLARWDDANVDNDGCRMATESCARTNLYRTIFRILYLTDPSDVLCRLYKGLAMKSAQSVLSAKHFHDENAAYKFLEARIWPTGPVCPHCGGVERISKMQGKSTRIGAYKCYQCRMQFTGKVGTVFESSHVKLHIWLQAVALLSSSKKGISSNQLSRTLGVTLKTAWFMSHRIREAMRDGKLAPLGGSGVIVEMDETYHGKVEHPRDITTKGRPYTKSGKTGPSNKRAIVSLVERGGKVRSFHVEHADQSTVTKIVNENLGRETRVHTDESRLYARLEQQIAEHHAVNHSLGEYVRDDVHTNNVESYFSVFKRGMRGTYQHCAERHLHRYLAEFDFRHNNRTALGVNDVQRADGILTGIAGKRLTYRTARN